MPALNIIFEGDNSASDIPRENITIAPNTETARMMLLRGGMVSGRHSVSVFIPMGDGKWVFWEISAALFINAAQAFQARISMDQTASN